jgi:endogenous inhibitor of DNA gyrase (YacG/DUF329 family)
MEGGGKTMIVEYCPICGKKLVDVKRIPHRFIVLCSRCGELEIYVIKEAKPCQS